VTAGQTRRADQGRTLHGRTHDLAVVDAFVDGVDTRGGSLLIGGEAGVGKTALLSAAVGRAADGGLRVLRAAGARFEGDLRFAGLHQILHPLLGGLGGLGGLARRHRDVLTVAFGMTPGQVQPERLVADAAAALLRCAARARPLLLAIDDLPWLDRGSVAVLGSLELTDSRISLLAVTRDEDAELRSARVHELTPLDDDSAAGLLEDLFPGLAPAVRRRIVAEASGNPLGLVELPTVLNAAQFSGAAPLPSVLPLNRRLQAAFGPRVAQLPEPVRQVLLVLVLDGTGKLSGLRAVLPERLVGEALREAQNVALVDLDRARAHVTFRHPLIRSAVLELATASDQRRAHETLARQPSQDADRRTWHLAQAASGPDEHVAEQLEQLAHQLNARGDADGAVGALTRSAALTPNGRERGRRTALAAYLGADLTGRLLDVPRLLDEHRPDQVTDAADLTTALAFAHHLLLSGNGDVDSAYRLLMDAVEAGLLRVETPAGVLRESFYLLVWISYLGARDDLWKPLERAVAQSAADVPESLSLLMTCLADPVRTARRALPRLDEALGRLDNVADPVEVARIGMASEYVGRLESCRPALRRLLDDGPVTLTIHAMNLLSRHCYETGEWDELARLAETGLRLSDQHGYRLLAQTFIHRQGLLAAARGDSGRAQECADTITRFAAPRRIRILLTLAAEIRALAALGQGDYEDAFAHATSISPAGTLPRYQAPALWLILDVVEAAVRTGRLTEAHAHVAALRRASVPAISGRLALMTYGGAAMTADDDHFVSGFERALALPGAGAWPFDLARIRLAYGERLRRVKATQAAREQLTAAAAAFTALAAAPWTERAHSELRASGMVATRLTAPPDPRLSPQQYEIARLAAAGLTNKQIGQRLRLSPRTVGTHLYQIFPKLGVTARAALRDALPP